MGTSPDAEGVATHRLGPGPGVGLAVVVVEGRVELDPTRLQPCLALDLGPMEADPRWARKMARPRKNKDQDEVASRSCSFKPGRKTDSCER